MGGSSLRFIGFDSPRRFSATPRLTPLRRFVDRTTSSPSTLKSRSRKILWSSLEPEPERVSPRLESLGGCSRGMLFLRRPRLTDSFTLLSTMNQRHPADIRSPSLRQAVDVLLSAQSLTPTWTLRPEADALSCWGLSSPVFCGPAEGEMNGVHLGSKSPLLPTFLTCSGIHSS